MAFWILAVVLVVAGSSPAFGQGDRPAPQKKCVSDCDCPAGELCSPQSGSCQPAICTFIYAPVCGLDGKTYSNECTAHAQHIVIAHQGACAEECGGLVGRPCPNKDQFCEEPPGQCHPDGIGRCEVKPTICTKEYKPVCGCDYQTYPNDCQRRAAGVSLLWKGPCLFAPDDKTSKTAPPKSCMSNADCGAKDGKDYCARPEGLCDRDKGRCRPKPEFCIQQFDPVCGCNGVTYSNGCFAAAAGANVLHSGPCGKEPDQD